MKKVIWTAIALLVILTLLCSVALAKGNGPGGNGSDGGQQSGSQQQGDNPPQGGGQQQGDGQQQGSGQQPGDGPKPGGDPIQNQGDSQFIQNGPGDPIHINTDAIENAISKLDDEKLAAELTALLEAYKAAAAGDDFEAERDALQALREALAAAGLQNGDGEPMNFTYSYNYGRDYGRFLDVGAVAEAIATVTDEATSAALKELLAAYEDAVNNDNPRATQDALQALLDGLADAQLEVDAYTGLQLNKTSQGQYLDTGAVADAIAALTDADTAADLTKLLNTYLDAVVGGDAQAVQDAFAALMSALAAAGVQV